MTRYISVLLIIVIIMTTIIGCTAPKQAQEPRQRFLEEPKPQEVLGTMIIGFSPTVLASMPEPPIDLTLHIRALTGGSDLKLDIADGKAIWEMVPAGPKGVGVSYQNFRLMLPPGDYLMAGLDVRAKSLSDKPFFYRLVGRVSPSPKETVFTSVELERSILAYRPGLWMKPRQRLARCQPRWEVGHCL